MNKDKKLFDYFGNTMGIILESICPSTPPREEAERTPSERATYARLHPQDDDYQNNNEDR